MVILRPCRGRALMEMEDDRDQTARQRTGGSEQNCDVRSGNLLTAITALYPSKNEAAECICLGRVRETVK